MTSFFAFQEIWRFFRKNVWNIFGTKNREKWCFSWCFDSWLSILWVPFFQGLLRFLSHCPIKKDDIMYVIFSKIESLEKVCHCCSFCQMCLMPKKLLTTEVVFTGSCKLKSQNCSRHIDCCNWYESCKKLPWSTYFFLSCLVPMCDFWLDNLVDTKLAV